MSWKIQSHPNPSRAGKCSDMDPRALLKVITAQLGESRLKRSQWEGELGNAEARDDN